MGPSCCLDPPFVSRAVGGDLACSARSGHILGGHRTKRWLGEKIAEAPMADGACPPGYTFGSGSVLWGLPKHLGPGQCPCTSHVARCVSVLVHQPPGAGASLSSGRMCDTGDGGPLLVHLSFLAA